MRACPVMRWAWQTELAASVVAFEALAQVGLVQLDGTPGCGMEARQVTADGLNQSHAHQP